MTNTTPTLAEIEHLMQIASGELVLMRGRIRMEATRAETVVEFYLPAHAAPARDGRSINVAAVD